MKPFSESFLGRALSNYGEPSSKRMVGFLIVFFTMLVYAFKGMDYEFFVTWLGSGLIALGISAGEKLMGAKKPE